MKSLQLVRSVWPVGDEALANPAGEWRPPPVTEVTGVNRQVLGTYQLVAGRVVEIQTPRTLEVPQMARVRTDPRAVNAANPVSKLNPATGPNPPPQRRPLLVPPQVPGAAPSVPLPWRKGSPLRPARPGEPATNPDPAMGGKETTHGH